MNGDGLIPMIRRAFAVLALGLWGLFLPLAVMSASQAQDRPGPGWHGHPTWGRGDSGPPPGWDRPHDRGQGWDRPHDRGRGWDRPDPDWHRPPPHDVWRGGFWRHEAHGGRWGWWWVVDGLWYLYDRPIYPYPAVVSTVIVPAAPPTVVYPPAYNPPPVVVPTTPPVWYYCDYPAGYYPSVRSCATGFRPVPSSP